jgi:hypothetical protein
LNAQVWSNWSQVDKIWLWFREFNIIYFGKPRLDNKLLWAHRRQKWFMNRKFLSFLSLVISLLSNHGSYPWSIVNLLTRSWKDSNLEFFFSFIVFLFIFTKHVWTPHLIWGRCLCIILQTEKSEINKLYKNVFFDQIFFLKMH